MYKTNYHFVQETYYNFANACRKTITDWQHVQKKLFCQISRYVYIITFEIWSQWPWHPFLASFHAVIECLSDLCFTGHMMAVFKRWETKVFSDVYNSVRALRKVATA